LSGRILPGKDFGAGGDGRVDRELDAFGHGTAMASIMVARPGYLDITGLAPDAKILPIAVPLRGTTDSRLPDRLPDAIRWAARHGAKIISMSLGGKRSPATDTQPCTDAEQSAIYYALRRGALVIASVGNSGPRRNTVEDPAVCLGVVSVGAVDQAGDVASFSTRQPYLTLVAPGVNIASLSRVQGQAYSGEGTSQATAIASAVTALVWSKYPQLSADQVVSRIVATLTNRRSTPSPAYGYGELDAHAAVTDDVPPNTTNPVFSAVAPFLARETALVRARAALKPPPPAARSARSTGSFAVGSESRISTRVITGAALAGAGAVLLLVLLLVGIRGRRRRRRPLVPAPVAVLARPMPAIAPEVRWSTPVYGPPHERRPRPGPGPGPAAPRPRPGPPLG
jgi:subtilisin family serine protease